MINDALFFFFFFFFCGHEDQVNYFCPSVLVVLHRGNIKYCDFVNCSLKILFGKYSFGIQVHIVH